MCISRVLIHNKTGRDAARQRGKPGFRHGMAAPRILGAALKALPADRPAQRRRRPAYQPVTPSFLAR